MTDFLERYGVQFRLAVEAGAHHDAVAAARSRLRRRWRGGLIAVVVAGIAAPALAVTQPWQPILGRPDIDHGAPSISDTAVLPEQAKAIAELRRGQTAEDRQAGRLLRSLHPGFDGVNPASIRLLRPGSPNPVALVAVDRLYQRHDREGLSLFDHALCLAEAETVSCASTGDMLRGRFVVMSGARVYGLVPDSVANVKVSFADGRTVLGAVEDNLFDVTAPAARSDVAPDDPSQDASATFRSLRWLDRQGAIIGGFDPTSGGS